MPPYDYNLVDSDGLVCDLCLNGILHNIFECFFIGNYDAVTFQPDEPCSSRAFKNAPPTSLAGAGHRSHFLLRQMVGVPYAVTGMRQ